LSTHAAVDEPPRSAVALSVPGSGVQTLLTAGLAAILCAVAFVADGGLQIGHATRVEMGLILGGAIAVTGALALAPRRRERLWGSWSLLLLAALAALTALSITWAAQPADAWLEANRTLAYGAVFAAAVALAHWVPNRWGAVIGAITLAAVAVSAYAVLTKVFPGALNPDEVYARLSEPFGYWNAIGLMAALGVPGCLWLGARRTGHQALNALAYPALGLLMLTILLAYSRGALLAAGLGAAFWFATVPLRLRGATVLLTSAAGAGLIALWVFSQSSMTATRVPIALQNQAGLQFGLLLVVMLGLLAVAGLAASFAAAARPPSPRARHRAGVVLLVALALVPVGLATRLALSDKGLTGSISSGWETLTDPNAPIAGNGPSRLTAAGSVRARYWNEALKIFADNTLAGTGAGGYATVRKRYRTVDPAVRHAHGYVVQTLADLGVVGVGVSLALLAVWLASAMRATGLRRRDRGRPYSDERIGLLTLCAVVIVFGVHSFLDWTWFVPATAAVALLAAGWVVGRGPLGATEAKDSRRSGGRIVERLRAGLGERPRAVLAAATALLAFVAAWTVWQPLRAESIEQQSITTLEAGDADRARAQAQTARDRNPLSVDPLFSLATIELVAGRKNEARRALEQAVRLQPANPEPWLRLGDFELNKLKRPKAALAAIRPAIYLDPRSSETVAVFLAAQRQAPAP